MCRYLNGGPEFRHNETFSFQVATADQAETDRYWNAIVGNVGQESVCGWRKDKWGGAADYANRADQSGIRPRTRRPRAFDAMTADRERMISA
ncbi:MAG: VOC family protein [Chlorobiaceae bacterium]|nr:VOC family protein [Chlorobiaceae bacterium]